MTQAYVASAGAFLPGPPVSNADMIRYLGDIDGQSGKYGAIVKRQNKIRSRHYAISEDGTALFSNAALAARAGQAALGAGQIAAADVDLLCCATTQGDLLVPGHASQVHGELASHLPGLARLQIASFQSVCASASMALQHAALHVKAGESRCALVTGSEFSSRWFQPAFYRHAGLDLDDMDMRMAAEFLRWTLSDGGGALVLTPQPIASGGPHLRLDWMETLSLAHRFETCMFAGASTKERFDLTRSWSFATGGPAAAAADGAFVLLQDMALLKRIIRAWVGEYLRFVEEGRIVPDDVDWLLCHYSAHSLRQEIISLLSSTGAMIDEDKWFTNLSTCGNTGSAALFIMMEEFLRSGRPRPGQTVLCINPESGRAGVSFMQFTVV